MREIALKQNRIQVTVNVLLLTEFNLGISQHTTIYNINYALMQHVSTRRSHHQATLKQY